MKLNKKWYLSKTLWFNFATILLGLVEVVNGVYPLSPEVLMFINAGGNLILRTLTSKSLSV